MKCIVLQYPDGSIATRGGLGPCMLAGFLSDPPERGLGMAAARARLAAASPVQIEAARGRALAYVLEKLVPLQNPGATGRIADIEFPADRDFREAWRIGKGRVEVDLPKARALVRERLRAQRNPKLEALDVELMRAIEAGDAKRLAEIAAQKQALRDITANPAIEAARSIEELKAVLTAAG